MPRVVVLRDDGAVFWDESVRAWDFEAGHFRRCLADRLSWAVKDAEQRTPVNATVLRMPEHRTGAAAAEIQDLCAA